MKTNKTILKAILILIVSIMLGTVLLMGVYSFPTERIRKHIEESTSLFVQNENKVENWVGYLRYATIDNSTDSTMINISLCREYDSVIGNVMLNPRYKVDRELASKYGSSDLNLILDENIVDGITNYPRYWHGYLLYLIPCLLFTNVGGVRMIMTIVEFLLVMLLLYKVSKIDPIYMFAYAVTFLFINPITVAINLQNADIYVLTLMFSIIILYFNDWLNKNDRYLLFFMIIGICTSYFDFLTYPVVSFGIPAITMLLVNNKSLIENIKEIVLLGLFWIIGYIGMWASKWILASLFTNTNVIEEAINSLIIRGGNIGNDGKQIMFIDAMNLLNESINDIPMISLLLLSLIVIIVYGFANGLKIKLDVNYLKAVIPYIIIGLVPFAWAFVVRNHFATHQFLEYRTMAITVLSILITIIDTYNLNKKS